MTPETLLPWLLFVMAFGWAAYQRFHRAPVSAAVIPSSLRIDRRAISLLFTSDLVALLQQEARQIFKTTSATRVLLLYAINGKRDFRYVTCVFESNRPEMAAPQVSALSKIVDIEIDADYRTMIKQAELTGDYHHITRFETGLLSQIYRAEGIESASVVFVSRCAIDPDNDVVVFTTVASPSVLTEEERLNIRLAISPIRLAAQNMRVSVE